MPRTEPIAFGDLGIGPWHIGTNAAVTVDAARADALHSAMNGISMALAFEDRYAMIIDNLMDLERHLFNWALIDMLRPRTGMIDLFTHKRDANRLVGNLLSSCRQYIDQTKHHVQGHLDVAGVDSRAVFAEEYNSQLSYRVMEALRNYMQHEDLGVHTASIGGSWIEGDGKKTRRYVVSIGLDLDYLANASQFKAGVLAELKALPRLPDLKQTIREYVSGLGVVHNKLRTALKPQVDGWLAVINQAFTDVGQAYPEEKLHLLAVFKQNERNRTKLHEVWKEPMERLTALQVFNQTRLNLGPAYASSEALP